MRPRQTSAPSIGRTGQPGRAAPPSQRFSESGNARRIELAKPAALARLPMLALALGIAPAVAVAQSIPSGGKPSPRFGAQPFTQRLLLAEEFGTEPMPASNAARPRNLAPMPVPATLQCCPDPLGLDNFLRQTMHPPATKEANTISQNPFRLRIEELLGRPAPHLPADGRPAGQGWSHQRFEEFPPKVYVKSAQTGARTNNGNRDDRQRHNYAVGEFGPGGLYHNTTGLPGSDGTTAGIEIRIHPNMPVQDPLAVWTFDGTLPPKLLQARYGEGVLFRHYNALPVDPNANMGFGHHTITTHLHNGHTPAESDGYMHAFFYPGQFWDYNWPMIVAGHDSINTGATDPRMGRPDGRGGITRVRGDWRETQSSLWFHDHALDYTSQKVYKGNAALMNLYSAVDRGNEAINDGVNLRLPSGTALDWGNRDYDVNLLIADKAWDQNGQLWFNPFEVDGFLGDTVTVNWQYSPYLEVRARRYRFRLLNGCVARYFKIGLIRDSGEPVEFHMVANDGNIMEHAVAFDGTLGTQRGILPELAIGERYDIVVDFAQFKPGERLYFVNLLEHTTGRGPNDAIDLEDVLTGVYAPIQVDDDADGIMDRWAGGDPAVGKFMEFRVMPYAGTDLSMNPTNYVAGRQKMIPLPRPTAQELASARRHELVFGRSGGTDETPWTIKTNGGPGLTADYHRVSIAPQIGELQIWKFTSGGGWAHPVHAHFEEAMVLSRNGEMPPEWERWARKDVFRIGDGPDTTHTIEIAMRFREFAGSYVEHCHNTTHEDLAMLLRWDIERPGQTIPLPAPVPDWEGVYMAPSSSLPLARDGVGFGSASPVVNNGAATPVGVITVTSAEYRIDDMRWKIEGSLNGSVPGAVSVRAFMGPTLGGTAIGSGVVQPDGTFEIDVKDLDRGNVTRISLDSTSGAILLNRTFAITTLSLTR